MEQTRVQCGFQSHDSYLEYAKANPELFEWVDDSGKPHSRPYPLGFFDKINSDDKAMETAVNLLNRSTRVTQENFADNELCLTSLKHMKIVEELIAGFTREQVAKNNSVSVHAVNRVLYSPFARKSIANIINSANARLAANVDLMVEVAANQLMTLMTTGDSKSRLAAIDRTFKFYEALNKMGLANGAKVSQTKTIKNNDGSVDKMTVSGKINQTG